MTDHQSTPTPYEPNRSFTLPAFVELEPDVFTDIDHVLADPELADAYIRQLNDRIAAAEGELRRFKEALAMRSGGR